MLKELDADKFMGVDGKSGRIVKECAEELCGPIHAIIDNIFMKFQEVVEVAFIDEFLHFSKVFAAELQYLAPDGKTVF